MLTCLSASAATPMALPRPITANFTRAPPGMMPASTVVSDCAALAMLSMLLLNAAAPFCPSYMALAILPAASTTCPGALFRAAVNPTTPTWASRKEFAVLSVRRPNFSSS